LEHRKVAGIKFQSSVDFSEKQRAVRWVEGLMSIFTCALWIIGALIIPETSSPVILRRRAAKLSKLTDKIYKSRMEVKNGKKTASQ